MSTTNAPAFDLGDWHSHGKNAPIATPMFAVFDVETRPQPDAVKRFTPAYPAFEYEGPPGNYTKAEAINAHRANSEAKHKEREEAYWLKAHQQAALNPLTASVLVIGVRFQGQSPLIVCNNTEADTLRAFWSFVEDVPTALMKWCYWTGCGDPHRCFDIDMIVTRSRILGVRIPQRVRDGRFYHSRFVNLSAEFLLNKRDSFLSLSKAADAMGLLGQAGTSAKNEADDVRGENFWQWWEGLVPNGGTPVNQNDKAAAYLHNDLALTYAIAERMLGVGS